MYRWLLFFALLNSVELLLCIKMPSFGQKHTYNYNRNFGLFPIGKRRDCERANSFGKERLFEIIADNVAELDNKVKTFCSQDETSKEIYEQDFYKLIINLPNFHENNIEVKFKHRVLYIKAERGEEKYENVKILPDMLNAKGAKWYYGNHELTITVPYKAVPFKVPVATDILAGCKTFIDSSINNVPKTAGPTVTAT